MENINPTPANKLVKGEYVYFIPNKEGKEYGIQQVEGVVDNVIDSTVFINDIHHTKQLVKTKSAYGDYIRFSDILKQKNRNVIHNNNKLTREEFREKYKDLGKIIAKSLNRFGLPFERIKVLGSFANKDKSNDIDIFIVAEPSDLHKLGKGYDRLYENALANIRYMGLPIEVVEVGWDNNINEKAFGRYIDIYDKKQDKIIVVPVK